MTLAHVLKKVSRNGKGNRPPLTSVINRMLHYKPKTSYYSPTGMYRKARDTVLVMEAAAGPLGKGACAIAQALATSALVFGVGVGAAKLITLYNPTLESMKREFGPVPENFDAEDSSNTQARLGLTYFHMASSLLSSSFTAFLSFRIFRNKAFLIKLGDRPMVVLGVGVVSPFLMASLVHKLPPTKVKEGVLIPFGLKELGHLLYAMTVGFSAAPLYIFGGLSIFRAAFVTAGACAGLEAVIRTVPKDVFLGWGTPLFYANAAVLISFIMTLLLRRDHKAFMPFYRIMMHGGLPVYCAHYLHIGQTINHSAKSPAYDSVNASMALTMDLLNLYARFAFLLPPHFQLSQKHHFVMKRGGRSTFTKHSDKSMGKSNSKGEPENDA